MLYVILVATATERGWERHPIFCAQYSFVGNTHGYFLGVGNLLSGNRTSRSHLDTPRVCVTMAKGGRPFRVLDRVGGVVVFHGTNISHLGKRKIIFKSALGRNMLVPRRVIFTQFHSKELGHFPFIWIGLRSWLREQGTSFVTDWKRYYYL